MPRTPDEILEDLKLGVEGRADIDVLSVIHEIIEDVNSSWMLALSDDYDNRRGGTPEEIKAEVDDYVANHYGEI